MLGFSAEKAIQVAAHLLKRAPGRRMNYMRLCKLIYLADRKSLELRNYPMVGDKAWAMERGPVPGTTLDLIKGVDSESDQWARFISKVEYDVELVEDPGTLALSRSELKILDALSETFRDSDEWDMVKWCHKHLQEFEKNDPSKKGTAREKIPLEDILEAIGKRDKKDAIVQSVNDDIALTRFFEPR